jgi:hypothetical protein
MEIRNGIAYISADSKTASDPDLFILDITDSIHVQVRSFINTGPGIASITIAGNRIYAAAASTAAQLHIIRLDSLDAPILEKKYQLPLPYATATPPFGSAISYEEGNVYLGTEKWDGEEFSIVSVADPMNPVRVGGFEVGSKVSDIASWHQKAYIATAGQNQMIIADVSNSSVPIVTYTFSPSGWQRQEGKAVSIFEDSLRLTRTSGGFNIVADQELFGWDDTHNIRFIPPVFADISGGAYGVVADRHATYAATRTTGKELSIFSNAISTSTLFAVPLPVLTETITCDNNSLYVLGHGAPVIYEIHY